MATLLSIPTSSGYKASVRSSGSGTLHLSPSMAWVKKKLLFAPQDLTSVSGEINASCCSDSASQRLTCSLSCCVTSLVKERLDNQHLCSAHHGAQMATYGRHPTALRLQSLCSVRIPEVYSITAASHSSSCQQRKGQGSWGPLIKPRSEWFLWKRQRSKNTWVGSRMTMTSLKPCICRLVFHSHQHQFEL